MADITDESVVRIEQLSSSSNLVDVHSFKRQEKRATYPLRPQCSTPTFDEHRLLFDRSKKIRLVSKYGSLRVTAKNVPGKTKLYFKDLFTTMIDLNWLGVISIFCASYVISWVVFGLLWWLIVAIRGPSVCISGVSN